ncbi:MAG: hypothetical protein HQL25_01025 [Candidatus Omnitrophica bacterium]|nr:hypothetical protein [Candidatus Omnitrophota bacterium]
MDDFEWLSMTLICVVVAALVFNGATLLVRKGFKDMPKANSEEVQTVDKQREDFIDATRKQQDRARDDYKRKMDQYKRSQK